MPIEKYQKELSPEAKARHRAYVIEHINCPACSKLVMRANMSKHRKTKVHMDYMKAHPDWTPPPRKKRLSVKEKLELATKTLTEMKALLLAQK